MIILMTTDTVGGVWTYSLELARALQPYDIKIVLATMGGPLSDDQRFDVEHISNVIVMESRYDLEWMTEPWDDVAAAGEWLQAAADMFQPDVVHLNTYAHGALDWQVPVVIVAHSCVLSWHRAVRHEPAGDEWAAYARAVSTGLRGADVVVAPTESMRQNVEYDYGPLKHFQVIPNGRHTVTDSKKFIAKKQQVIAVGRMWDEAKNLAAVVRAAPRLEWPVRVASWPHPDGELGEQPNVDWLGRLPASAMNDLYRESSILAHPARYEPFGLVPLEAALAGCALVLGDIDSLRENWDGAAMFVPPDDDEQLAYRLNQFSTDASLRSRYAAMARHRADRFSPKEMGRHYAELYRRLRDCSCEKDSIRIREAAIARGK